MGNLRPNLSGLKKFSPRAETYSDRPLSKRPLQIFVGQDIFDCLAALPTAERVDFLRRVISEAVRKQYLKRSD